MSAYCDYCLETNDWLDMVLAPDYGEEGQRHRHILIPLSGLDRTGSCLSCQDILRLQKRPPLSLADRDELVTLEMVINKESRSLYVFIGAYGNMLNFPLNYVFRQSPFAAGTTDALGEEVTSDQQFTRQSTNTLVEEISRQSTMGSMKTLVEDILSEQQFPNISLARQWLQQCDHEHALCKTHHGQTLGVPLLLVDVQNQCVTTSSGVGVEYAALSYKWGNVQITKATSENIEALKRPGSLASPDVIVPKTIRDAISVTVELGLKYIWIDSLCIIQDDPDIQMHLKSMASIYSMAHVTLIVADADNVDRGIKGKSGSKYLPCLSITLPNHQLRMQDTNGRAGLDFISHQPWTARAWTFQEGFFARRAIIFNGFMSWLCGAIHREDGGISQSRQAMLTCPRMGQATRYICHVSDAMQSNWDTYSFLIQNFNSRALTFEKDVMRAFAGIVDFYGKAQGGLLYGHPLQFLAISLLWQQAPENQGKLKNRDNSAEIDSVLGVPSWSWFAWHGSLDLTIWRTCNLPTCPTPLITIHTQCRQCPRSTSLALACCSGEQDQPGSLAGHFGPHLRFEAQRARFRTLGPQGSTSVWIVGRSHPSSNPSVIIGEMRFNDISATSSDGNPAGDSKRLGRDVFSKESFEFVAIAEGQRVFSVPGLNRQGSLVWGLRVPPGYENEQFVYALCVVWPSSVKGGAERIGIGVIMKRAWDLAEKEEVDVVLG